MSRPKKAPVDRRDDLLAVRLTSGERAELERSAGALGLTVAEFMRRRALGYRLPPLDTQTQAMASLAAALMPIGVNLNQLTRTANAGRLLPHSIEELATRITALLDGFYGPGADERGPQL
ncbi:plasmid mobilization relaxosome protein MobC [Roseomonas frigidaquae]|uniref:Plasmid mobilization relaxosome protein MobC n=1 Tax=Falsiroseomonas frigidaquae TaxID=487318 RepID=A0ABX1F8L6_9PROT|nr:plasmid mobilization relaxosome protein MobC [Falsiroseomonas frigidaquae]NKE48771.1 plasmid mobilization relaxosome protein MobC [Falsiroseomonas frigidaquae]